MAVNVTVRDIVNYPGGTAKTITVDIVQIVPVAGNPEGDEIWVSSATTSATASGGGSIQNVFKNEMKRGWLKSSAISGNIAAIPAGYGFRIAIDEDIASGVNITLTESAVEQTPATVAADIEAKIKATAVIGGGGAKAGDLSYLNVQVRYVDNKFQIESGTVSDTFTGTGKSSVAVGAPTGGDTDVRSLLGLIVITTSETLSARDIVETTLATQYTGGIILSLESTTGFSAGSAIKLDDGTNTQTVLASGVGVAAGLAASEIQFVTYSGGGLANTYPANTTVVRLLHEIDVSDPVSAITTVDELYRFSIDTITNQINFA